MNDEFTRQAVAISLRKMFEGTHFNICAVDEALAALKLHANRDQYQALRPLHCVHWRDMPAEFRDQVMQRTLALFAEAHGFDLVAIDRALGVPVTDAVSLASSGPEKRKAIGLLPFQRRA